MSDCIKLQLFENHSTTKRIQYVLIFNWKNKNIIILVRLMLDSSSFSHMLIKNKKAV
ncbi:unnamed protein product [Callosobruchus maculatus]|uniref:Uncharacterized protein n=1 Tax=Callosobruchus maculatus TaxID=64391 RepID=A0A653C1K5_CALMS|nr:unnamed protein product [Callosobruchus maculatus]